MISEAEHLRQVRTEYWTKLLRRTDGNVSQAAKLAGRNRTYVHRLLVNLGVVTGRPRRRGNWESFGL